MFTGLVHELGTVVAVDRNGGGARLRFEGDLARELQAGDSVAVNGVCLTATDVDGSGFAAQAMTETLGRSSLGELEPGALVNLELALRASDRLGGHVVQGHVDGLGTVRAVHEDGFARVLEVEVPPGLLRYVVEKGSIAIDGVSLTVSALGDDSVSVSLIPETLQRTNLGAAKPGMTVNLEVDVLAKYVEKLVAR